MRRIFYGVVTLVGLAVFAADVSTQKQSPPEQNAVGSPAVKVAEPVNVEPTPSNGADAIQPISQPDADYVNGTTLFQITPPDLTVLSSLTDGKCTVNFAPPLQVRTVGMTWATWGSPPDTEGATPRILFTQGATSLTLTSPDCSFATFGFEAEPNPFAIHPMTARFFSGDVEEGAITRDVSGQAGARLFAANTLGGPFTRVVFSSTADFAIARLRYAVAGGGFLEGNVSAAAAGDGAIAGARVRAEGPQDSSATTNPEGNYRLRLIEGTYTVTASAFGFLAQAVKDVGIVEKQTTTLDFVLDPAPNFQVSGTVTDPDVNPLPNVPVRILGTPLQTTTGKDGTYLFGMVPQGTYQIQAGLPPGRCLAAQTQEVVVDMDVVVDFALERRVDAFGYACDDGHPFEWKEASTVLPLSGDDDSMPVTLPFPFEFYGLSATVAHVSTNGFLNFASPDATFVNRCIPDAPPPNRAIYAFWDDLFIRSGATVRTQTFGEAPNREFVIEWRDARFFGLDDSIIVTFEINLHENGDIVVKYNRVTGVQADGRGATIGIENPMGTVGLQYSCNEPVVSVGRAIRFFRP